MLELEHGFQALDVHARLPPSEESPFDPERLERELEQAGITRAVVFPPAGPERGLLGANNAVARGSVDRPFVPFARIGGPQRVPDGIAARLQNALSLGSAEITADDVEQYAIDDRFHGFVLDPRRDGLPEEDTLAAIDASNLPLVVHAGAGFPLEILERVLLDRSIPIIVAHFGGYPLDRPAMERAIDMLARHDRCYLDSSHTRFREPLERAIREHPDRILFGSGTPAVHPTVAVTELLTLDVPEDGLRKVFTANPARVVGGLGL
jgi:hypothetical protein